MLGGDSLIATRIIGLVKQVFKVEVSMRQLLDDATIAGMAMAIEEIMIDEMLKQSEEAE